MSLKGERRVRQAGALIQEQSLEMAANKRSVAAPDTITLPITAIALNGGLTYHGTHQPSHNMHIHVWGEGGLEGGGPYKTVSACKRKAAWCGLLSKHNPRGTSHQRGLAREIV